MRKFNRILSAVVGAAMAAIFIGTAQVASAATTTVPVLLTAVATTSVYDAPSTTSDFVGQVLAGQTWFAYGIDTTGKWVYIEVTPGTDDWAAASAFNLSGLSLPVIGNVTGSSPVAVATAAPAAPAPAAAPAAATTVSVPVLLTVATTQTVYNAPSSVNTNVLGTILAGQTWFVYGTNTKGDWLYIEVAPGFNGWVPASTFGATGLKFPVVAGF